MCSRAAEYPWVSPVARPRIDCNPEPPMSEAFNPDYLRQHLRPLAAAEADAAVLAYQAYYGLDLRSRHPRLQARLGSMAVDGRRLAVQAWLLPEARGSLLLMHGYYDHMGLYRHVVDWALGMGFSVLACDLPGHGLSEGERASIRDFAEYQAVFKGLLGQAAELDLAAPWHLCGQSTGGAILLDYLLHGGERPELGETILLAPLVRPRAWGWSKLSYRLLSPFVDSIPRRFSENSSDPQFLDFLREHDPLQPRTLPTAWVGALTRWVPRIERATRRALSPLVVQGESDETVDWRHGVKVLREKFDEPRILLLEEARHHLANESEGLRRRYFDFLSDALGA
ncbi:alpha/beta hydrolase [Pseudomonas aeruginosa]|nr:alpha/beta hydrolase [Pseudomonas aeruginosa]RPY44916.1 alpha/beta hydrolase [Pseudomonas aeruginosa]